MFELDINGIYYRKELERPVLREDDVYQEPKKNLKEYCRVLDVLIDHCIDNPTKPLIGTRFYNDDWYKSEEPTFSNEVKWMTYIDLAKAAISFSVSIHDRNLCPINNYPDEEYENAANMRVLGIYGSTTVEYLIIEMAASCANVTFCPLYDTFGEENMKNIIRETRIKTLVIEIKYVSNFLKWWNKLASDDSLREILKVLVIFTPRIDLSARGSNEKWKLYYADLLKELEQCSLKIYFLNDLIKYVQKKLNFHDTSIKDLYRKYAKPTSLKDVNTICYTSGTTGVAKGCLQTNANFMSMLAFGRNELKSYYCADLQADDILLSYLPCAHVFERIIRILTIALGLKIFVFSGVKKNVLDDIRIGKVTILPAVSKIITTLVDNMDAALSKKSGLIRWIVNKRLEIRKKSRLACKEWNKDANKLNSIILKPFAILGNVRLIICGASSLSDEVRIKMECYANVPIINGYGASETTGPVSITGKYTQHTNTLGGLLRCQAIVDYGYQGPEFANLNKMNRRGELLIKGKSIFAGYFRRPDLTRKAFFGEREKDKSYNETCYYRTGDVVQETSSPLYSFIVVGRSKCSVKLSYGEFVDLETIEQACSSLPEINQIFAYAVNGASKTVALIFPNLENDKVQELIKSDNLDTNAYLQSKSLTNYFTDLMFNSGKLNFILPIMRPKNVTLVEEFTILNKCLTPTFKFAREKISEIYHEQLSQMLNSETNKNL